MLALLCRLEAADYRRSVIAGHIQPALAQREHRKLVDALDSDRYWQLLSDWQAFLRGPSATEIVPLNARVPLAEMVSRRAWRLYRRIVRSSGGINGATAPAELHEVRIAAKKLRYLVDISPSFYQAKDLERILTRSRACNACWATSTMRTCRSAACSSAGTRLARPAGRQARS